MKIKKGDIVQVISGVYRGKEGRVLSVINSRNRLVVEGINMLKKHTRPTQENQQGGIVEKEGSIHVSNVMLLSGSKITKIGYRYNDKGIKERFAKSTGKKID